MTTYFHTQYLEYFNKFLDQLDVFFTDANTKQVITTTKELSNDDKFKLGRNFINNMTNDNFNLFIDSKIKVFSHKSESTKLLSESYFGSKLSLKQLLNNQPADIKKTCWAYLHVLYLYISLCAPVEDQKIDQLERLYSLLQIDNPSMLNSAKSDATEKIYNLLNVEVNNDTKDMIDDIVKSFDPLLANKDQANPVASIMQISQTISSKYADKINSGEIELEKIMNSIKNKIPGMENVMNNFANMKNNTEKSKEKVIINENYSTSNVDVGENKDNEKSSFNIGKILKAADAMGVIPGAKSSESGTEMPDLSSMNDMFNSKNMPNINDMFNSKNMPNINDMLKLMSQMHDPSVKLDPAELEKQMSNMGINVKDINNQFMTK